MTSEEARIHVPKVAVMDENNTIVELLHEKEAMIVMS